MYKTIVLSLSWKLFGNFQLIKQWFYTLLYRIIKCESKRKYIIMSNSRLLK